jgi:hypothetical protein
MFGHVVVVDREVWRLWALREMQPMAMLGLQLEKGPKLLQWWAFATAFVAPGVQPLRRQTQAMDEGAEHGIGIQAAAVFAADRAVMARQGLAHMVQQALAQKTKQGGRLHRRGPAGEGVVGTGVEIALLCDQHVVGSGQAADAPVGLGACRA